MLSKQDIEELKGKLQRGYFKRVMKSSGLSKRTVSNFFEGKVYKLEIHQAVLDEIESFESKKTELINRQKSISHV